MKYQISVTKINWSEIGIFNEKQRNYMPRKWLSPTRNLVSSLFPWRLLTLNIPLGLGLRNLRIVFLKALTNSEFQILYFELIQLNNSGWEKKRVLKVFMFNINKGICLWFMVTRIDKALEIMSKRSTRVMLIF